MYSTFRLFARPEACLELLLIVVQCRWCDFDFCICRSCFRGQAYCCDECRYASKLKKHREAERKYRQTEKGKKAHREAENRRRRRQNKKNQKNMDDAPSTVPPDRSIEVLTWVRKHIWSKQKTLNCWFCSTAGQVVSTFPRRGYG